MDEPDRPPARAARGAAPRAARAGGRSGSSMLLQVVEGHAVAVGAVTDEAGGDEVGKNGRTAPFLALVDVREVHLDERDLEELERVVDRPLVVRPRAGVDDDAVDGVVRVVAPLDELPLVVRLPALHGQLSLTRPLVDPALELGDRQAAVQLGVATAEHVEIDTVEDEHSHVPGRLSLPPGGAGLRERLTTLAARPCARDAWPYSFVLSWAPRAWFAPQRRPWNVSKLMRSTYRVRGARPPREPRRPSR